MRTITIEAKRDIETIISNAREAAAANGADFDGDATSGTFSGMGVEGNYRVNGETIEITITDKPFFLTWDIVENQISSFFQ